MEDPLHGELRRRRNEYQQELAILQKKIDAIDLLLEDAQTVAPKLELPSAPPEKAHLAITRTMQVTGPDWKTRRRLAAEHRRNLVEACIDYLQRTSVPVPRNDLLTMLISNGHEIPSANKASYVTSLLWHSRDRIVTFFNHGYWLADRPYPSLEYQGVPGETNRWILSKRRGLKRISTDNLGVPDHDPEPHNWPPEDV